MIIVVTKPEPEREVARQSGHYHSCPVVVLHSHQQRHSRNKIGKFESIKIALAEDINCPSTFWRKLFKKMTGACQIPGCFITKQEIETELQSYLNGYCQVKQNTFRVVFLLEHVDC